MPSRGLRPSHLRRHQKSSPSFFTNRLHPPTRSAPTLSRSTVGEVGREAHTRNPSSDGSYSNLDSKSDPNLENERKKNAKED
ncbi:hypothetical protein L484_012523 [Morus notabilis]|uniref:Uncharacterized protein n=1 Tax=Morus notabilis TaxID=981085 RepID=W9QQ29_9ROSA|nr:hypothetical protein L484_012523 [Morus notabilis]